MKFLQFLSLGLFTWNWIIYYFLLRCFFGKLWSLLFWLLSLKRLKFSLKFIFYMMKFLLLVHSLLSNFLMFSYIIWTGNRSKIKHWFVWSTNKMLILEEIKIVIESVARWITLYSISTWQGEAWSFCSKVVHIKNKNFYLVILCLLSIMCSCFLFYSIFSFLSFLFSFFSFFSLLLYFFSNSFFHSFISTIFMLFNLISFYLVSNMSILSCHSIQFHIVTPNII